MKASEHMLLGCSLVTDTKYNYLYRSGRELFGCALATALVNKLGSTLAIDLLVPEKAELKGGYQKLLSRELKLPMGVIHEVERLHCVHGFSREAIARWMAEAGY